ncbi:Transmembrane amino acid transporter family protein [Raphanus sativus]|uniref:Amino acid transporter AVT6E-like n=1 Tax=Raphanus sativus TaxID=3726 RepID=A0A6J0K389_RAPSA|nr:amino acid transporter AVT6E-like [Raphanus sativus]KAJ4884786.1 Transmembrane amino acid transporter family protein [Raphanus sativus]
MDSSYSAISKNSYVELQKQNKFLPLDDEEKSFVNNGHALDSGSNQGSGISGAVFNLTTSIIGAGIMALPATMKVLGLVLGLLLILLIAILSEISVELLVRFSALHNSRSYGEVVQSALGKPARVLSEICIVVNNGGFLVVYLIIMGDVMSGSLHHVGVLDQWLGNGFWDHRKVLILIVVVVFLAPLCALNKIDSLSVTSAASVALAVVFVVVCFVVAAVKLVEGTVDDAPRMSPDFGSKEAVLDLLVVIPIMTNAYVCHFNVQPIYNELEGRTPAKMNRVGRITTAVCVVVYASTAVSGYLLFGKDTESDILTNFDRDLGIRFSSAVNYVVRVGYVLHLVLVFPVIHFSLRETVDTLLFEGSPPLCESKKRSLGLTVVLLALIYIGSTMIPNIWTAFKFTGATSAVSLGFTFPALIALRLGKRSNSLSAAERSVSWLMLILAVVVSVVGTLGNVYSLRSKSD